jgi:PAS domain S-box-containing protein
MLRNIKISVKIAALILGLTVMAVVAISLFTYHINLQTIRESMQEQLVLAAANRAAQLEAAVQSHLHTIRVLQAGLIAAPADSLPARLQRAKVNLGLDAILLVNQKGEVIHSTVDSLQAGATFADPDGTFFAAAARGVAISTVKKTPRGYEAFAGGPWGSHLVLTPVNLTAAFSFLKDEEGLGATGEIFVARQDPVTRRIIQMGPLRSQPDAAPKIISAEQPAAQPVLWALQGHGKSGPARDYNNEEVLAAWKKINGADWALVAKINEEEITGRQADLSAVYWGAGIAIALTAVALAMFFARSLTEPLNNTRTILDMVARGELPERSPSKRADEFGLLARKVDQLVQTLRASADFAQKVGEGKFDTAFQPASANDTLGLALLNMRANLVENERRDTERNWIVRGVAQIGEILRMHDSLDAMGEEVIQVIIEKIGAVQGAFYVVNDESGERLIEMRTAYAYNRKKYLKKSFRFAEGLVGQAAIEQDTVMRTEIPDDYVTLTSGLLGEQKPGCILIVPLITNEEVFGVLEFAGIHRFNSSQVKFVQELSLILARTIFNIKVNERTRRLLAESQAMSNELKEKQEVLRQNAEEMQATQEELQRTNQRLEEQIEEVNRTQKRLQLLLENASEVITIYEENRTIRYSSASVAAIFGYKPADLQGRSDRDFVHADYREVYDRMFEQLAQNPAGKVTVQYEYRTKSGNYVWVESTGTNNMSNPAIHGYIVNSRDITERRRAEQEQRMRSKMQALSENSLDLITRLEHDGISYINPVIEELTGRKPGDYLGKKVREADLHPSILERWLQIVEQTNATNEKVSLEMDFPTRLGAKIMQVNAIPEFDENNSLESVLVVSHDITERKLIELDIQNKNKKINDSINYAKRIQNAILPNTRLINRALPDSFILYKPRDVVSGDFPWFVQLKNEIFIAAVDCTGHGVPGALLSLIGYFLLNDIVRSRRVTDPGKILDLLDEGVTATLRQDQDESGSKDGMDIALCRIHTETREVAYAGAHRPLYLVKNGTPDEVKGNKFPIGGGIFKNQTNFTTHKMQMQKGDSIYFCSDGYPDQFGGPEGRKMGPRRVRELIQRAYTQPMREAVHLFDTEWENWRGNQKQTDDVLLIGIKF